MDFGEFRNEFFTDLKAKKKELLIKIDSKKELLRENLGENATEEIINSFVEDINTIILESKRKFSLIEKVLKKDVLKRVYASWKNSNVLVKACKNEKASAIKWLLTMEVNPSVQDENGMTALMYAVKNPHLLTAVKLLCYKYRFKYS